MFGAQEFILKFRHLSFSGVDRFAKICSEVRRGAPVDGRPAGKLGFKLLLELHGSDSQALEHGARETIGLP